MSLLKPLFAFMAAAAVSASVSVGWAAGLGTGSSAVDQDLPDLGSPATAAVSLDEEYRAGLGWFAGMRQSGQVLEDPEISDYIQQIGHSLSSHAEEGQHQFYYFVMKDPVINAFAMPGGFIAINSGLILATNNENELAGVMAHETAHVTQRHLVRGLIDQSHAGLMSTAAMLAAELPPVISHGLVVLFNKDCKTGVFVAPKSACRVTSCDQPMDASTFQPSTEPLRSPAASTERAAGGCVSPT